jgi:hypothetical protein
MVRRKGNASILDVSTIGKEKKRELKPGQARAGIRGSKFSKQLIG